MPGSSRLSELLSDGGVEGYARATEPRRFSFPGDHGAHPAYRNEWWYVTGNLDGEKGDRFGFELTIFRFSLAPDDGSDVRSDWRTNQAYIGHFAITDANGDEFHVAQRFSRGGAGLAGATRDPYRIWIEDWSLSIDGVTAAANDNWRLKAAADNIALDLDLRPLKAPVLNGIDGLSQKSAEAGNASYYYSISRIATEGQLSIGGETYSVSGLSWLDREWGSSALSREQRGWDWFALQLSDSSELMFYNLRRDDGSRDPHSAGTWIAADGQSSYLRNEDVDIEVRDYWDSEQGGRYPGEWQIRVPRMSLTVDVVPVIQNQELVTTVRYWEGAVDVSGEAGDIPVTGRGYVELTGYAPD